jgi:hypothetical protein
MPLAEKGVRGRAQPLSPPQHWRDPERDKRSESASEHSTRYSITVGIGHI